MDITEYILTLKDDERFELMTVGSETNCNGCTLGAILCNPDVHSVCDDLVD